MYIRKFTVGDTIIGRFHMSGPKARRPAQWETRDGAEIATFTFLSHS